MDSVLRDIPVACAVRRRAGPVGLLGPPASASSLARLLRAGWIAAVLALTVAAIVFGHAHRGPFSPLALVMAAAATAPLLLVRRWPTAALGLVVAADAAFVVWAR